ncbi:MAG: HAD-IIIC family phosphatase [Muribaculaceae bacterium]|nr:HAD-IIIC family phosphatase [Muribaculaceae bacterium]
MKTFQELKKLAKNIPDKLPAIRLAVLGDSATQLLCTALKGMAAERGYRLDIWEADFNQIELQILNPESEYSRFDPDFTIVFHATAKLLQQYDSLMPGEKACLAQKRMELIRTIAESAKGKLIYFDYPEINDNIFGSYGLRLENSFIFQLRKLNYMLCEFASKHPGFYICGISDIQNRLGRRNTFDANIYISTEMVLGINSLPYIASRAVDIIAAAKGKFRKCIILDLDNTLWGGIVGDDGWEGIQIGHGLGIGKAFSEFQSWIKKLKERGIILAVCSKNNESTAMEAFEKNPEMILRPDDFAMFVANWNNKADNIRHIQHTLNIGFDSMVFIDDNPFERDIVRQNIPDICVPEMPEDPAEYVDFLSALNLFETTSYSSEDAARNSQYRSEALRSSAQQQFTNEDDFLKSLQMKATTEEFNPFNTPRVAQLTQRSNQFNLRTVRYNEDDIRAIAGNRDRFATFAFSLNDKYGDNGLISVVILEKKDSETLFIDTWLMSCRVLKRGMERYVTNEIVRYAAENGFKRIIGEYIPSAKNKMVEEHYPSLGFSPYNMEPCKYVLYTGDFSPLENHIS